MRKSKLNCWEYHNCGRETGGIRSQELGVCPVAVETRLDGVHYGNNAGRACWVISGTLCKGEVQGTFAKKFFNCEKFDFYQTVKKEEVPNFNLSATLLSMLKSRPEAVGGIANREENSLCSTFERSWPIKDR